MFFSIFGSQGFMFHFQRIIVSFVHHLELLCFLLDQFCDPAVLCILMDFNNNNDIKTNIKKRAEKRDYLSFMECTAYYLSDKVILFKDCYFQRVNHHFRTTCLFATTLLLISCKIFLVSWCAL